MSFYRGETVNGQRFCSCGCGLPAKRYVSNGRFKGWRAYAAGHSPHETTEIKVPTDPVVLAYIAGVIDGEGCIYARAYLRGDNLFHTILQLQVTMCSASVVKYLYDVIGGRVYSDVPQTGHAMGKRRYCWSTRNSRVKPILEALLPYLIEKRKRAELAIELASLMGTKQNNFKHKLNQAQRDERIKIAAAIKEFNRNPYGEDPEKGMPLQ